MEDLRKRDWVTGKIGGNPLNKKFLTSYELDEIFLEIY